ncbi:tetratricopeptide repeat protein [Flavobacteriaceae bacterium]|nr:tetratricopeptide repeat protein [Flavobacteriaceae bacterium]
MFHNFLKFLALNVLTILSLNAQNSSQHTVSNASYAKGLAEFNNKNYQVALSYFNATSKDEVEDEVLALLKLESLLLSNNEKGILAAEEFISDYEFSVHKNNVLITLANYYFKNGNEAKAMEVFGTVDVKLLGAKDEAAYNYKYAFTNYKDNNYTGAKTYLIPLSKRGAYKDEANYYLGNIALEQGDFTKATQYLNNISSSSKFGSQIIYQQIITQFKLGDYKGALAKANTYYSEANEIDKNQLNKIIGESSFYLKDYNTAIAALEKYQEASVDLTYADFYFLGYAYFKKQDYLNAITNFNKIITANNKIAQNSYFNLANCYLKTAQKSAALNAFKNASEMDYDVAIKEQATLNYAKLSYEIGNPYVSSSEVLQAFVDAYPSSKEAPFIKKLIVNAYLQYKDYEGAIAYYQRNHITKDITYQNTLLSLGFEQMNANELPNALKTFEQVSLLNYSSKTQVRAVFWRAEVLMRMSNFKDANYYYGLFLENKESKNTVEYNDAFYGVAYSYFHLKKYKEALANFKIYEKSGKDSLKLENTILRIADCNFVNKQYWPSLDNYNKVIANKSHQQDYAWYQKALAYGFLGKNDKKRESLVMLQNNFKNSPYLDKSYYQLGSLNLKQNKTNKALASFKTVVSDFENSSLVSKSQLKLGIIYFNTNDHQNAIKALKQVVADYPGSTEAVQAVKIAEQVYKENDEVEKYASWVKGLEFVNVTESDIDKTMFGAAETRYLENNLAAAIPSLKKYLINYPKGMYSVTANYYLAQSYVNTDDKQRAIAPFKNVLLANTNEYTDVSLTQLSQIYLENENYEDASSLLERIVKTSLNEQSKLFAISNLMKYSFSKEKYKDVLSYAQQVLDNPNSSENLVLDAYVYGARGAVKENKKAIAKKYFQILEEEGSGVVKAESLYYKALFLHQDKNYKESNVVVQNLASQYQKYRSWGIKGLLIMAKNFHELKDHFQADFILKNVIENASEFPELMEEAKQLKEAYKAKQVNVAKDL